MKIKVRKFREADARQVLALNRALSAAHGVTMTTTVKQLVKTCLQDKLATCFVAESGGKIAGFVVSYDWMNLEYGSRICYISQLYTHEKFRRYGIGLALVRHAAAKAVQRGCFRMETRADKVNKSANAFYKKAGLLLRNNQSNRFVIQGQSLKVLAQSRS